MLLSFVEYLDSHHPYLDSHNQFREFNDLPEPLRLTDAWFDCLLGAVQYFLSSSILEFQLFNSSGQHKQRIIHRSVPESSKYSSASSDKPNTCCNSLNTNFI